MVMTDAAEFISRARSGSPEAFSTLVRLYQARIRTYLDRFLSTHAQDLVDDLAQQTFLDAYRALSTYDDKVPFDYWLLRIAKNRALTYLRDEERRNVRGGEGVESLLSGWLARRMESGPDDPAENERKLSALRACLRRLPERSARMIEAYYFAGRNCVEIAGLCGMKHGAIRVALLRVRQALRECITLRLAAPGVDA